MLDQFAVLIGTSPLSVFTEAHTKFGYDNEDPFLLYKQWRATGELPLFVYRFVEYKLKERPPD